MPKITKSIRVDSELWKKVKVHVAESEVDISSFVEDSIKERLQKKK